MLIANGMTFWKMFEYHPLYAGGILGTGFIIGLIVGALLVSAAKPRA